MDSGSKSKGVRPQGSSDEVAINEPRCKVCASPHREEIDLMLAGGRKQSEVRKHWNQVIGEGHFTANNISVHARKHLSARDDISRRLSANGASRTDIASRAADMDQPGIRAATEAIIHGGLQALHAGLTVAEPRDVLAASRVLTTMDIEDVSETIKGMERDMKAFMQAVKDCIPKEDWERIFLKYEELLGLAP